MDYTVQEIRFTAEDYVSCVDLFYYLKAKGKNISYDLRITSIDSCGIDFNGDFYNYKLSDEVLDTAVENIVEDTTTRQEDDIVLNTLQAMSDKVDTKYIARVLATEYMIHGYDFLDMEDGTLYVYTTYGETKEVIPVSLHRFFTYVGNINKLPLLYYLID